jgi:hypothetical protein
MPVAAPPAVLPAEPSARPMPRPDFAISSCEVDRDVGLFE